MPGDRYAEYYAVKLWQLLPAVYRSLDSGSVAPGQRGPLREIVNRIAAQAAVMRRSIDRMWEDQSIESCDDWIIPYIGDLLGTRLVSCLDARAQRIDVAKTIYYRRREGTVGLLEELASDIAGRDARVVEFFRHLGRTRHCFDPPIGLVPRPSINSEVSLAPPIDPPPLALIEGLSGAYTRTSMGGYADLRHHYGASRAKTAIDEYFYTADFRRGRQSVGWHNIPKLGVFVWWLSTWLVPPTTPVEYALCPNQFTFDPTGREIPLFAATRRAGDQFGESWTSPDEWQLPGAISQPLFDLRPDQLYADTNDVRALGVFEGATSPYALMGLNRVAVNVERGRFRLTGAAPADGEVHTQYHYGFGSDIGAGSYDQRVGGGAMPVVPDPVTPVVGGGNQLATAVGAFASPGTLRIDDSLTYDLPGALGGGGGIGQGAITGKNKERPVIRAVGAARPQWTITGTDQDSTLVLQGIHLVGADLVLAGQFGSVRIRSATLDPGTSGAALQPPTLFASAADGQPLWPTRLFIEADVNELIIERAITGAIRTRNGGAVEVLRITDSIVQAIAESEGGTLTTADFYDADALIGSLKRAAPPQNAGDPLSVFLFGALAAATQNLIASYAAGSVPTAALLQGLTDDLNVLLAIQVYQADRFAQVRLSAATSALIGKPLAGADLVAFNRRLLQEAYPVALADVAIATRIGQVQLARTTVLGPMAVHRLDASECILDDVAIAADAQHGCIRFSAYAEGSAVHQPYESVSVAARAPLFRTRDFGRPDYARLRDSADAAILSGRAGASIIAGAENGSEMGAFERELVPLKRRGLVQKFAEFMPVGLMPVWIDVT
jgi:hypothetical protein